MTTSVPEPNETLLVQAPKVTFGFERKVSLRQYESATASVYVQADVPLGATAEQVEAAIRDAAFQAKAAVYEQLGVAFEVTPEGAVMELLDKVVGPVEVVSTEPKAPAQATKTDGAPGACEQCGKSEWWDNRENKRNPKAPDYKCKGCGKGVWLKKKGSK